MKENGLDIKDKDMENKLGLIRLYMKEIEGVMNYTISTLLSKRMKPESGWRYKWIIIFNTTE